MDDNNSKERPASGGILSKILDRLGSMNLAILLLLTLCLIMLAGTLTAQKQALAYYQEQYGPFWSQLFDIIHLFNLYSSPWFVLIVLLLLASISACVWRNAPRILASFGPRAEEYHPGKFTRIRHWDVNHYHPGKVMLMEQQLLKRGYSVSRNDSTAETQLYARRGGMQKLGYLLIHIAILIIIIGGLLDGQIFGSAEQNPQTGQAGVTQATGTADAFSVVRSFELADMVDQLVIKDDTETRHIALPFAIQVLDANDEYYSNGQLRDYSAQVKLIPRDGTAEVVGTVTAEKSFQYDTYTIAHRGSSSIDANVTLSLYQFGVGSPLLNAANLQLPYRYTETEGVSFVMDTFRGHNADPTHSISLSNEFQDIGPSIGYQILNAENQIVRFDYYLRPINRNGNEYYLLRASREHAAPVLIFVPIHPDTGINRFLTFNSELYSKELITLLMNAKVDELFKSLELDNAFLHKELVRQISVLLTVYANQGREAAINKLGEEFKEADKETASLFAEKMLDSALYILFEQVLLNERTVKTSTVTAPESQMSSSDLGYFTDTKLAVEQLKNLGVNTFPVIHTYERKHAVMLSVSRQPGKYAVLSGMFILLVGVLMIFYINYREYFIRIQAEGEKAVIYVDGYTNRQDIYFNYEYDNLTDVLLSVTI